MVNILEENIDWEKTAEDLKARLAAKKAKAKAESGSYCFICKNFVLWAQNNCNKGFVCWSCRTPVNKVIYDYEIC